jgi:hypothetical protein
MLRARRGAILDENAVGDHGSRSNAINTKGNALAVSATGQPGLGTVSCREVFLLAAVLAATALTGAAAVAGLKRSVPPAPAVPQIGQTITPATPAQPQRVEPGD